MKLTFRHLFLVILFAGIFLFTLTPVIDADFWWHLRTGQLIAQSGAIPHTDPFSYTMAGAPWIAHEWLAELLLWGLYRLGGYALLIFAFGLLITAAFWLVYLRCPVQSRPYLAGFALLLGIYAARPVLGVRPQMLSLLFTSIFLLLLDRFRHAERLKDLIPLPFITILWVNMHAGYFLGLGIIGVYLGGGLIDLLLARPHLSNGQDLPTPRGLLQLAAALVLSLLVALVNPNTWHILVYPFQTLTDPAMQQYIMEWFSPDYHKVQWLPLAAFLLMLLGASLLGKKPVSITRELLTLGFAFAALRSERHVPLFMLVAIPVLAEQLASIIPLSGDVPLPARSDRWLTALVVVVMLLADAAGLIRYVERQPVFEAEHFPKAAVDWLLQNQPKGRLFNAYNFGGYLIWRAPHYPVYIDGRADLYGAKFFDEYIQIEETKPGWEAAFAQKDVQIVFVEEDSYLGWALRKDPAWQTAYEDDQSVILLKRSP